MTDDLERRLRDWMHEDGEVPTSELARVAATVSTLPDHGRGRLPGLAAAAVLVLVVVLAAVVMRPGGGLLGGAASPDPTAGATLPRPTPTSAPTPPDPAAFSGDPRLFMCGGVFPLVEFAFEMRHAADYQRHLPAMLLSPELDVPQPAFVAIYRQGAVSPLQVAGAAPPPGTTWPPRSFTPGLRDICVVVAPGELDNYQDVDITGMRATLPGDAAGSPPPWPSPTPPWPSPTPTEIVPVGGPVVTPSPAPAITEAPTEQAP